MRKNLNKTFQGPADWNDAPHKEREKSLRIDNPKEIQLKLERGVQQEKVAESTGPKSNGLLTTYLRQKLKKIYDQQPRKIEVEHNERKLNRTSEPIQKAPKELGLELLMFPKSKQKEVAKNRYAPPKMKSSQTGFKPKLNPRLPVQFKKKNYFPQGSIRKQTEPSLGNDSKKQTTLLSTPISSVKISSNAMKQTHQSHNSMRSPMISSEGRGNHKMNRSDVDSAARQSQGIEDGKLEDDEEEGMYGDGHYSEFMVGGDNFVNILELVDDEEDGLHGAVDHELVMISERLKMNVGWMSENWHDVLFVLKQKYAAVCYLNCFQSILELFHYVTIHLKQMHSFDLSPLMTSAAKKPPSRKSRITEDIDVPIASSSGNVHKKRTIGDFITSLAKLNPKQTIWRNQEAQRSKSTKAASVRPAFVINDPQSYFIRKSLAFYFKTLEESVKSPLLDYEKLVSNFEAMVRTSVELHKTVRSMILEGFFKLFQGLEQFGYMMDLEDYSLICSIYFTVVNASIKELVLELVKPPAQRKELMFQDVLFESVRIDLMLDFMLKKQKQRTFLVDHLNFKLGAHFELMKEVIILSPKSHPILLANAFSCLFVYTKYSDSYKLIRNRLAHKFDPQEVLQPIFLQMLEFSSAAIQKKTETFERGMSNDDFLNLCDITVFSLTSIEKHMQQLNFFESLVNIHLDTLAIKECLIFLQRLVKVATQQNRKEYQEVILICKKLVSILVFFISSKVVSMKNAGILKKFTYIIVHLEHLSRDIKSSKCKSDEKALELSSLMQSLSSMILKVSSTPSSDNYLETS